MNEKPEQTTDETSGADSAPAETGVQVNAATGDTSESAQPPAEVTEEAATDEQQSADAEGAPARAARSGRSGLWRGMLFGFILLAVAAGAGWYFAYVFNQNLQAERADKQSILDRLDGLQQSDVSLLGSIRQLDYRLTGSEQQIAGLLRNLNSLYLPRAGAMDWKLAEIEHLLRIASRRLTLAADLDTAQAVLQSVDVMLRDLPDPALLPVREQLIADLNLLKSTPRADFSGLVLTLAELAGRADQLPLKQNATVERSPAPSLPPAEADSRWRQFTGGVWQELKSLLVISRADRASVALLMPHEHYLLQRNLRLQLEAARLSILSRDQSQLRASVKSCLDWLNEFFDTGDERVRNALEILETAARADLDAPTPSINATLQAFDEYLTGAGQLTPEGATRQ